MNIWKYRFVVWMFCVMVVKSRLPSKCASCQVSGKCNPPKCVCCDDRMTFPRHQQPQLVFFTFDDAVGGQIIPYYRQLFSSDRLNPNGCPISMTLFVSHDNTNYQDVKYFFDKGMEIAVHSVTHSHITPETFAQEASDMKQNLVDAGIPEHKIKGWRSPYLEVEGDVQFQNLSSLGFTYDATLTVGTNGGGGEGGGGGRGGGGRGFLKPFTLDHGWPFPCRVKDCPVGVHPGFWEVPIVELHSGPRPCVYVDACPIPWNNKQAAYDLLWENFINYYDGNRAPLGFNMHAGWFYDSERLAGMDEFILKLISMKNVYIVTVSHVIDWLKQPTSLIDIMRGKLTAWNCENNSKQNQTLIMNNDNIIQTHAAKQFIERELDLKLINNQSLSLSNLLVFNVSSTSVPDPTNQRLSKGGQAYVNPLPVKPQKNITENTFRTPYNIMPSSTRDTVTGSNTPIVQLKNRIRGQSMPVEHQLSIEPQPNITENGYGRQYSSSKRMSVMRSTPLVLTSSNLQPRGRNNSRSWKETFTSIRDQLMEWFSPQQQPKRLRTYNTQNNGPTDGQMVSKANGTKVLERENITDSVNRKHSLVSNGETAYIAFWKTPTVEHFLVAPSLRSDFRVSSSRTHSAVVSQQSGFHVKGHREMTKEKQNFSHSKPARNHVDVKIKFGALSSFQNIRDVVSQNIGSANKYVVKPKIVDNQEVQEHMKKLPRSKDMMTPKPLTVQPFPELITDQIFVVPVTGGKREQPLVKDVVLAKRVPIQSIPAIKTDRRVIMSGSIANRKQTHAKEEILPKHIPIQSTPEIKRDQQVVVPDTVANHKTVAKVRLVKHVPIQSIPEIKTDQPVSVANYKQPQVKDVILGKREFKTDQTVLLPEDDLKLHLLMFLEKVTLMLKEREFRQQLDVWKSLLQLQIKLIQSRGLQTERSGSQRIRWRKMFLRNIMSSLQRRHLLKRHLHGSPFYNYLTGSMYMPQGLVSQELVLFPKIVTSIRPARIS